MSDAAVITRSFQTRDERSCMKLSIQAKNGMIDIVVIKHFSPEVPFTSTIFCDLGEFTSGAHHKSSLLHDMCFILHDACATLWSSLDQNDATWESVEEMVKEFLA